MTCKSPLPQHEQMKQTHKNSTTLLVEQTVPRVIRYHFFEGMYSTGSIVPSSSVILKVSRMSRASRDLRCAKRRAGSRSLRLRPALQGIEGSFSSRRDPAKQGPALDAGFSVYPGAHILLSTRARVTNIVEISGAFFAIIWQPPGYRNSLIFNTSPSLGRVWDELGKNMENLPTHPLTARPAFTILSLPTSRTANRSPENTKF